MRVKIDRQCLTGSHISLISTRSRLQSVSSSTRQANQLSKSPCMTSFQFALAMRTLPGRSVNTKWQFCIYTRHFPSILSKCMAEYWQVAFSILPNCMAVYWEVAFSILENCLVYMPYCPFDSSDCMKI